MASRNKARAEAAISALHKEELGPGNGEVVWLELDLSDPRNAKKAAKEFMAKEDRLDVLSTSPSGWMLFMANADRFVLVHNAAMYVHHLSSLDSSRSFV